MPPCYYHLLSLFKLRKPRPLAVDSPIQAIFLSGFPKYFSVDDFSMVIRIHNQAKALMSKFPCKSAPTRNGK
jgi:hypothetical protein